MSSTRIDNNTVLMVSALKKSNALSKWTMHLANKILTEETSMTPVQAYKFKKENIAQNLLAR